MTIITIFAIQIITIKFRNLLNIYVIKVTAVSNYYLYSIFFAPPDLGVWAI